MTYSTQQSFLKIFSDMVCEYQKISGITLLKTSDVYIKLKTLASQIFCLDSKLEFIKKQAFPQTATGIFLDYHAQTRGLSRKKSKPSSGILTFSITSPLPHDVIVPKGTICYSTLMPEIKFSTLEDAMIKTGETQTKTKATSMTTGITTNAVNHSICNMCNPPEYIEKVVNESEFRGGIDQESDESLRTRLLDDFKNISNGCNTAYYKNIVMNYDGVLSTNIIPRKRGRGTVDIIIATNKHDDEEINLIKNIQEELQVQKEINVDVLVLKAKSKKINIQLNLEFEKNINITQTIEDIKKSIKQFVLNLKVYEPLKLASLGSQIFKTPGIKNYKFLNPTKDVFIDKDEIICLDQIEISI